MQCLLQAKDKLESHLIKVVEQNNNEGLTNEIYYGNLDLDTSTSEEEYYDSESCDRILLSAGVMKNILGSNLFTL